VTVWDAPNQQVVRADQSAPWDEGSGGEAAAEKAVDDMTKAELLAYAQEIGASPANNDMTKAELRAAVDEKLAGG
jgi:hypothetical protein